MKKWIKRFLIVVVILVGIPIFWLVTISDIPTMWIVTRSDEDVERFKEWLEDYISTPGNNIENSIITFYKLKITFYRLTGNYEKEKAACETLVTYYEYWRYLHQRYGADAEVISQWFANKVPFYKEVALLELQDKILDSENIAFYYSELCRSRTLTDHYSDVLVSKSYAMLPDDKEKLQNYRIELEKIAKSGDEEEYLKLKREERKYKRYLRKKYSNLIIPPDWANKEEAGFTLEDTELQRNFWENFHKDFRLLKGCENLPDNACFIEFLKISDDSMIAFVIGKSFANPYRYEYSNGYEAKTVVIPTDKKLYENLKLYHDLNAYPDINALHRDGKYFWSMADGTYKITVGRNSPNSSATAVNDNAKWIELRQTLSVEISQRIIQPVEKLLDELEDREKGYQQSEIEELQKMYQQGIESVQEELETKTKKLKEPVRSNHWIISPDAELNLIPFETLIYHDKMLVESVNVSYVPSLAVLNMMQHRERKNFYLGVSKDLFAMGNAVYGDNTKETSRGSQADFFNSLRGNNDDDFVDMKSLRWNNLPGTDKEVDKVAALFESKDIFKQNDASEKNLKEMNEKGELAQYKYLLFSTHGLFVPEKPEWSSIVLSQEVNDEDDDGYVTTTEWMGYDLRSSLVYLSACETGLGDYQVGEGIVGIPYALTVAGNKDTVMSLWKVDDDATAEFTATVFEKIKAGKTEVAALNETKREFLKKNNSKYSNPSVWSAFVLYGI